MGIYRKYSYISTEEFKMLQKNNNKKSNKFKIIISLIYLCLLSVFIGLFFSYFSYEEITSYKFIQTNRDFLLDLKNNNLIFLSLILIFFTIIWVILLGFGSPIALVGGFIFGKWFGCLLVVTSLSIGATVLYIIGKYFFIDIIKKNFYKKFQNLESKFKKNEFKFFLIYRLIGGIPFGIANLLPVLFNVSLKNYFLGTFFGILPVVFIFSSLGSGLEKTIGVNQNVPSIIQMIVMPEIHLPILGFFILILIAFFLKKILNSGAHNQN